MIYDMALVPFGKISRVIPALLAYLDKSARWTAGRAGVDDIVRFVMTGQMQLWVIYNPEDHVVYMYVITEIKQYPQKSMLVVQYCAGEPHHLKHSEEKLHSTLERFAVDAGCKGIEFFGRPGWGTRAKKYGYTVNTVVYEKHFDEVGA